MSAIDFPNSPTVGQTFSAGGMSGNGLAQFGKLFVLLQLVQRDHKGQLVLLEILVLQVLADSSLLRLLLLRHHHLLEMLGLTPKTEQFIFIMMTTG